MATARLGEDGLIPLVQNFSPGRAFSFRGIRRRRLRESNATRKTTKLCRTG